MPDSVFNKYKVGRSMAVEHVYTMILVERSKVEHDVSNEEVITFVLGSSRGRYKCPDPPHRLCARISPIH